MARKIATAQTRKPSKQDTTLEELDTLHPEREVPIGDTKLVVREYGAVEWMRLLPFARPLIHGIAHMLERGEPPMYEEVLEVISGEIDALLPLVAQSADIDVSALDHIKPDELDLLLMTWWGVNGRFFISRAVNRVAVGQAEKRRVGQSAGAKSTPPSSPTGTTSTESAATQSDS